MSQCPTGWRRAPGIFLKLIRTVEIRGGRSRVLKADYVQRKEAIQQALVSHLHHHLKSLEAVTLSLNTLDSQGSGTTDMYLLVLGTSAEDVDSGEVGRGNQENGLIVLNRRRGSEVTCGKNPISHVGMIDNVLPYLRASRFLTQITGLRVVIVWLCSKNLPICPSSARNAPRDTIPFARCSPALPALS